MEQILITIVGLWFFICLGKFLSNKIEEKASPFLHTREFFLRGGLSWNGRQVGLCLVFSPRMRGFFSVGQWLEKDHQVFPTSAGIFFARLSWHDLKGKSRERNGAQQVHEQVSLSIAEIGRGCGKLLEHLLNIPRNVLYRWQ